MMESLQPKRHNYDVEKEYENRKRKFFLAYLEII